MTITPEFQTRAFTEVLAPTGVTWDVTRFAWSVIGGPAQAEIMGYGGLDALAAQFDRLRCPVILRDLQATPVWWGYVAEVELRYGATALGVSIDPMGNWATVLYSEDGTEETLLTDVAVDAQSVATYGVKEVREHLSGASEVMANARRDFLLAAMGRPVPMRKAADGDGPPSIRYTCRGWWSTLGWRYVLRASAAAVSTTAQIADLIAEAGPFFTGVTIARASTIATDPARDGKSKALDVILELLKAGDGTALRLLATVDSARRVRIVPEPDRPAADDYLLVGRDGTIHTPLNVPLPAHRIPVGQWARDRDIPPTLALGTMIDPTRFFLEEAEFTPATGRWAFTPRGAAEVIADLLAIPM